MTHDIVGPCHPHLLDANKLIDSVGTPILEFIEVDSTTQREERNKFIKQAINQCLQHGLPEELIEKYESVNKKRSNAVRRSFQGLFMHLRRLSKNQQLHSGEQFLIDKSITTGEKLISKLSKSVISK